MSKHACPAAHGTVALQNVPAWPQLNIDSTHMISPKILCAHSHSLSPFSIVLRPLPQATGFVQNESGRSDGHAVVGDAVGDAVGEAVAEVGVAVAEVGGAVAEVGEAVAEVGDAVAGVGDVVSEVGGAVAEVGDVVVEPFSSHCKIT
mmetsp:Transcript_3791/g.6445  ORF Transcript_3791/g.6445 Transcript_3791/m.6445 type:complete len:147 (+) Transcript_3791:248-688(+)